MPQSFLYHKTTGTCSILHVRDCYWICWLLQMVKINCSLSLLNGKKQGLLSSTVLVLCMWNFFILSEWWYLHFHETGSILCRKVKWIIMHGYVNNNSEPAHHEKDTPLHQPPNVRFTCCCGIFSFKLDNRCFLSAVMFAHYCVNGSWASVCF